MVALLTLHLQPQPARRLHRHRRCTPSCRTAHVDHMHPDAVIAIAACANAEELTKKIFGGAIGWLPWQRPGFELGLKLGAMAAATSRTSRRRARRPRPVHLGPDIEGGYETTLAHHPAGRRLARREHERQPAFGGPRCEAAAPETRRAVAAALMPLIRGMISRDERKVGHFDDAPAVLEFVNSHALDSWRALGTSCPDHFLRTKIRPLVLPFDPKARCRCARQFARRGVSRPIAPTMPPITSAASARTARRCATPTR